MFICLRRHDISFITSTFRRDLIFLQFEARLFTKVTWRSFVCSTLVRTHPTTLSPALNGIYRPAIISFSLYLAVPPSSIWWDRLTKLNRSFCPTLLITPLILMSCLNKLVWFKYLSSLMKCICVIPVAAARVPGSVLPTS